MDYECAHSVYIRWETDMNMIIVQSQTTTGLRIQQALYTYKLPIRRTTLLRTQFYRTPVCNANAVYSSIGPVDHLQRRKNHLSVQAGRSVYDNTRVSSDCLARRRGP